MRFELKHPDPHLDRCAAYGWDRALGFFVSLRDADGRRHEYDLTTSGYDPARPLQGALNFLVDHGYLDRNHLETAMMWMQHSLLDELDPAPRMAGQVVMNFKRAAD